MAVGRSAPRAGGRREGGTGGRGEAGRGGKGRAGHLVEGVLDADPRLGRRLHPRAAELLRQFPPLVLCHLPLAARLEVELVANHHHGHLVGVLDPQDLLSKRGDLVERALVRYAVNAEEPLAGAHVLVAHRRVLLLARRVEDVEQARLIVDRHLLAVRVLDRRVVLVNEVVLDQLDGERRLADAAAADDDQLVLSHLMLLRLHRGPPLILLRCFTNYELEVGIPRPSRNSSPLAPFIKSDLVCVVPKGVHG